MEWINRDIEKIERTSAFPFKVKMLYFSHQHKVDFQYGKTPEDLFEISIRLEPHNTVCCDIINGNPVHLNFPNVVCKKPGGHHRFFIDTPRDAISFGYPAEQVADFKKMGMYPDTDGMSIYLTPEIKYLTEQYRKCCLQLYTPGVADKLDWLCFQLYRELLLSHFQEHETGNDTEKIRNISVWLQMHFSEDINLEDIARSNGFSRASFFKKWKLIFQESPVQYLLNLKMEAAIRFLKETELPIVAIIHEIHFSGTTAFHKRFMQKYGMTPDQYRKQYKINV